MNDDKKQNLKKNLPNSFVWFLIAAFLLALTMQSLLETRYANVAFSYQLEHLANLQLTVPEDNRKTALNDNLVTFSGKFRERKTEEGKLRYKYLELLEANNQLTAEKERLQKEITSSKARVEDSVNLFLQISGIPVPSSGYEVVDESFNTLHLNAEIAIKASPSKAPISLPEVARALKEINSTSSKQTLDASETKLVELVNQFRSPQLGIGSETTKQTLKKIDGELEQLHAAKTVSSKERVETYQSIVKELQGIVDDINQPVGHVKFLKLRAVRNYKELLDEYGQEEAKLEDNTLQLEKVRQQVSHVVWFFNGQEISTRTLEKQDPEKFNHWFQNAKEEWSNFETNHGGFFRAPDQPLNTVLEKTFKSEEPAPNYINYLFTIMPVLLVMLVLYFVFSRQMKGMGGSAMNFGKSPAKMLVKGSNKVTFKDVAGIEEAKEELQEIVDFLKNPQKFTALGGKIPKGVLCIGPPGTGKTLIAKAVAGEADRPFFSISGSDFVEMFVGVGASRIRSLFEEAKKNAPCIVFIDEIDAVGRHRGAGIGGGHDEREQTLNQLLVEMDGFDTNEGVILMAATNRPDVLDKALLRPGRFDRHVVISLPDIKGRFDILKVHAKKIKMDVSVDLMSIARSTPGCSGADLANLLNEAALLAAKKGRSAVTSSDIVEARDKVLYGKERRSLELDENEKTTTAYHESGHAVVGLSVKHADPVDKVTIIPRGLSLGSTMFLPKKNRVSYWKNELHDQLAVLMGGRVAEEIFLGDVSSGAQQDIERATQLARNMVCRWGMSEGVGIVDYGDAKDSSSYMPHHEKSYSEETAREIDKEVRQILEEAHDTAKRIIQEKAKQVELMTKMLMEFETLDHEDVLLIINDNWDIEAKRARLKIYEDLHKAPPSATPPPPPPTQDGESPSVPITPEQNFAV